VKIISAKDHGHRVVIRIVHNPTAPEWVHIVGNQILSAEGVPRLLPDGEPDLVASTLPPPGHTGETCRNCRYNWDVSEIVFDGPDLFHIGASGDMVRFTDDELVVMAFTRAGRPLPPSILDGLEGREG